ncbi:inositol monophosphatase family protein [Streptomyces sp. NPDC050315]|uniref:inositol monophosphatase family protein n=1 Tax=Streptomyces sp. NPDC050315 TaxID=3155039 RepID=UPI00341370ED
MTGDLDRERRIATAAAEEAGALLAASFNSAHTVHAKAGRDVVLDLDLAAEKIIVTRLREAFPDDRIVSEEAGDQGPQGGRTWLVDPLDGTNNVAIGLPAYAVGIGLMNGAGPALGIVHEPVTGATYHAVAGQGAYGPAGRLPGPASVLPESGPVVAWTQGYGVGGDPTAARIRAELARGSWRVLELWAPLLGWVLLARGTIDAFVGYCAEGVDLPAGALLAAEAGAELRTLNGELFTPEHTGPPEGRSFVAARGENLAWGQLRCAV